MTELIARFRLDARDRGERVELTYVEFELLRTMAAKPGRVFNRQALLEALWGDSAYREPRTIDVHVRHLREKLERDVSDVVTRARASAASAAWERINRYYDEGEFPATPSTNACRFCAFKDTCRASGVSVPAR